jgi:hypothetical protein
MTPIQKKRAYTRDLLLASIVVAMGFGLSGISIERLASQPSQLAQATPPLQSTPDAQSKPSAPAEPTTTGTDSRPSAIPPQPARPDDEAQKAGARPALPQAPAEEIGTPIKPR